jgi:hypothetical protein
MELIKNSENYNFTDVVDNGWTVTGSASNEVNGSMTLNINVTSDGEYIGDFYYNKPVEGNVHISYNVAEANRDLFVTYSDTVIDFVLSKL